MVVKSTEELAEETTIGIDTGINQGICDSSDDSTAVDTGSYASGASNFGEEIGQRVHKYTGMATRGSPL